MSEEIYDIRITPLGILKVLFERKKFPRKEVKEILDRCSLSGFITGVIVSDTVKEKEDKFFQEKIQRRIKRFNKDFGTKLTLEDIEDVIEILKDIGFIEKGQ